MLVDGIGTDIVEIDRIKSIFLKKGKLFLNRVYTKSEQDYCLKRADPSPCLAARFAAKEAVLKSLGTGLAGCRWTDVEVIRNDQSSPRVLLRGMAGKIAGDKGITKVLISISHDRGRAVAFALAVKGGGSGEGCYC